MSWSVSEILKSFKKLAVLYYKDKNKTDNIRLRVFWTEKTKCDNGKTKFLQFAWQIYFCSIFGLVDENKIISFNKRAQNAVEICSFCTGCY